MFGHIITIEGARGPTKEFDMAKKKACKCGRVKSGPRKGKCRKTKWCRTRRSR